MTQLITRTLRAGLFGISLLAYSASAGAEDVTIFEHLGSTDPASESWSGAGGFPIIDDAGSGFDAWATVDDTAASAPDAYFQVVTDDTIAQGEAFGWTLSARLRVVELPEPPNPDAADGSPAILYRDGNRTWQIHFGTSTITFLTEVVTPSGLVVSEITIPVAGGTGVHRLYELRYEPVSQTADLFIDGAEVLSDVVGAPFGAGFPIPKSVYWGSASTDGVGQGNFNLVRFEVVAPPVPALSPTALLVLSGSLLGVGAARVLRGVGLRNERP